MQPARIAHTDRHKLCVRLQVLQILCKEAASSAGPYSARAGTTVRRLLSCIRPDLSPAGGCALRSLPYQVQRLPAQLMPERNEGCLLSSTRLVHSVHALQLIR